MADRLLTLEQLLKELDKYKHRELHVHHTWRPNHSNFTGKNHQALQDGMRNFHVKSRKFQDIAQHVTLFPDGMFLTGRNFGINPASISGQNHGLPFCMEIVGDFDKGKDKFEGKQKASALGLSKYFHDKKRYIRFHREDAPKTCPGTSIDKDEFMKDVRAYGQKPAAQPIIKKEESVRILTGGLSPAMVEEVTVFFKAKGWWAQVQFTNDGENPRALSGGLKSKARAEFESWLKERKWYYEIVK
ncbi:hypothetical protein SLL00_03430 [Metabacillus indicus]|uniref:hypothetical protein n=1 Tax=Metabacillus indicus TaxID=246786 RepID=UPI002A05FDFB|nr:hypothetical protein [Metabacillus indicus]MDX8288825.1 hypothetical protein [Metabacillus indicus]